MGLEDRYTSNLRVVSDRDALLELFPKNSIVAELGVDEGEYSSRILSATDPEELHLIDKWDSRKYNRRKMRHVNDRFKKEIDEGRVILHRKDSIDEMKKFDDGYFDWVYIDTTHCERTSRELDVCRRKVKTGGIISGHDYCQGDVELGIKYHVVEAVHDFCRRYDWEIIYLTMESHMHLSYALRKIMDIKTPKTQQPSQQ